ncbi:glutamate racemase [Flavivirga aquatica]|uniref:Glutamate racemase n=1 Tax=Flavivirga aquatica TaxID=1849968 RepID=A0A1E5TCT4_9FLAO|nr:glutamate racemase [Flavivirga aquatica]OEK09171.1 glutamate racemase [Flavivirga aquatica]
MNKQPIGIFDSGVGGTSIWKEVCELLPYEDTIYLADSNNAPYGPKGKEAIINLSIKNTELLLEKGSKIIIVACNTATTNAIDYLRETYKVPFIGIEPAIKPAALQTKTNAIGILATKGTLSSELFSKTSGLFASHVNVVEQVGEGIVQFIESGQLYSTEMKSLLKVYLKPMIDANIDYLVLGCTHYPYLMPLLIDLLPAHVKIIDSGEAVARQTKAILNKHNLINTKNRTSISQLYTNQDPKVMTALLDYKFDVSYLDF